MDFERKSLFILVPLLVIISFQLSKEQHLNCRASLADISLDFPGDNSVIISFEIAITNSNLLHSVQTESLAFEVFVDGDLIGSANEELGVKLPPLSEAVYNVGNRLPDYQSLVGKPIFVVGAAVIEGKAVQFNRTFFIGQPE